MLLFTLKFKNLCHYEKLVTSDILEVHFPIVIKERRHLSLI